MKSKKEGAYALYVSWVKIYLDDIEEIIKIMNREGKGVEISDKTFKYESFDDLKHETQKRLKSLHLESHSPYITLDLGVGTTGGGCLAAESAAKGQFLEIKERLLQRKRWFSFLSSSKMLLCIPAAFLIPIIILQIPREILQSARYYNFTILSLIIEGILVVLAFLVPFIAGSGHFASINLVASDQRETFWTKNKDPIIRDIIVGLFLVLVGFILGRIH